MKMSRFVLKLCLIFTVSGILQSYGVDRHRKPLHYQLHQKELAELLLKFDSVPKPEYIRIGKSMYEHEVRVSYLSDSFNIDGTVYRNPDSLKLFATKIHVTPGTLSVIVQLLYKTKVISVKSLKRNGEQVIELCHKQPLFYNDQMGKGYVFYCERYRAQTSSSISEYIYYNTFIGN